MMVYELLRFDRKIKKLIETGASTSVIEAAGIPEGKSMFERGMRYVAHGYTSIEELLRSVDDNTV